MFGVSPALARSPLGEELLRMTKNKVESLIPPGYYDVGIQVGQSTTDFLAKADRGYILEGPTGECIKNGASVISNAEALPFGRNRVDLLVLPFALDSVPVPHAVLREAVGVLAAEGCLVVCGFNRYSMWSIRRVLVGDLNCNTLFSVQRLQDWLQLLSLELVSASMTFYRPPVASKKVLDRLAFMEEAGDRWWPLLGGCYVVIARKKMLSGTRDSIRVLKANGRRARNLSPALPRTAAKRSVGIG